MSVAEGPHRPGPGRGVACFAGVGPGEVLVAGRKAVGVTQWRTREGALLSTLLPASPMSDVIDLLASPPEGLRSALGHVTLRELGLADPAAIVADLARASALGPRRPRPRLRRPAPTTIGEEHAPNWVASGVKGCNVARSGGEW